MVPAARPLPLATQAVDRLIEALTRRTGLAPGSAPAARARSFAAALPADRLAAALLDLDAGRRSHDVDALLDHSTNRETYLFRDRRQLLLLERELSGMVRAASLPREITFWSAGCASGEEAYTLAILGLRVLAGSGLATMTADGDVRFADGWSLRVLGTDISADAIRRAGAPHFRAGPVAAFRDPSPGDLTHFRAVDGGFVPLPAVRRSVRFAVANLLDGAPPGAPFDVVSCRNVLFYFAEVQRRRALSVLAAGTAEGGRLMFGSTDSGPDDPAFVPRHHEGAVVHARRA
jgi:chemotaxis protein methyltransferase CheR